MLFLKKKKKVNEKKNSFLNSLKINNEPNKYKIPSSEFLSGHLLFLSKIDQKNI